MNNLGYFSFLDSNNLDSWRAILNSITKYYIDNTEKGMRESALNISVTEVELTPDFPFYELGIRGFYYDSSFDSYRLYVDLDFLNSKFYKTYCNLTNFNISLVEVISNYLNIAISDIVYNQKLFFNIDLSYCSYLLSNDSLSIVNLMNIKNSCLDLNFKHKEYSILFTIEEELEEVDRVVDSLNYLISKLSNVITLNLIFDTPYDLSLSFVYKLLSRLNKSSKLKLIIEFKNNDIEILKEFYNCNNPFKYKYFQQLSVYKSKFKELRLSVEPFFYPFT